jgi:hypothetical protein
MGAWGVVPSLAYITKVAACPTCHSLDKKRRPRKEFLPTNPDLGGSSWEISISLKNASLANAAGCQFCALLSNIFSNILIPESKAIYSPESIVTVIVPVDPKRLRDFRVTFNYNAAQGESSDVRPLSKTFYLATVGKCISAVKEPVRSC